MNSPVRLGVSPTTSTSIVFFSVRGFEALFPHIGTWLVQSVSLLSCSSQFICTKCGTAHSASHCLACPGLPALALLQVLSTWLPVSAPPAGLDECFFFNSSVVGLLYSLIFWQFWLFFKFKFVVFLLLVVRGGKAYLPMQNLKKENNKFKNKK